VSAQLHEVALPIASGEIAISLTTGEHSRAQTPGVEQIRRLHEEAIASAQRLIYLETQYLTSRAIHEALAQRMRSSGPQLDLVIVMPSGADTPKESLVLGAAQRCVLSSLHELARECGHALRVMCSAAEDDASGELVATFIHSKLLIVDDRILTVGSANCTNRSMSLDSELNFAWESAVEGDALSRSIARIRASLISEHAGIPYNASLEVTAGLVARIDALIGATRLHLREACQAAPSPPQATALEHALEQAFDPECALTDLELDELLKPRREVKHAI
jgi:phosphatidylserine/phosphatidylglycerophosphate/cardiolipin synthase-like enzyme